MSLINTCSTALLKNTENRTSSRPTYDIFLACPMQLFRPSSQTIFCIQNLHHSNVLKKCWRDRRSWPSVATDFPLNLCLPYWADVSYGAQEPNEDSSYLFSWVTVHDCDTLLLHTISIGKLRGVEGNEKMRHQKPTQNQRISFLGLGLNAHSFFLAAHFKRVPITPLFCVHEQH